jgi:hypothetical protein
MNILPPGQHATVRQLWAVLIVSSLGWFGFRIAFIVDCRMAGGGLLACWKTEPLLPSPKDAGAILAAAGAAGVLGYNTYNPNLRNSKDQ